MYLISACLVGINCRYDGTDTVDERLVQLMKEGKAIIACPEVLGELPIPREPCEIIINQDGKKMVVSKTGEEYTEPYLKGANKTLEICKIAGVDTAILKSRSPSCGCGQIYDGTFTSKVIKGNGLTAELLIKNNIKVFTEQDWKG